MVPGNLVAVRKEGSFSDDRGNRNCRNNARDFRVKSQVPTVKTELLATYGLYGVPSDVDARPDEGDPGSGKYSGRRLRREKN